MDRSGLFCRLSGKVSGPFPASLCYCKICLQNMHGRQHLTIGHQTYLTLLLSTRPIQLLKVPML